MVFFAIFFIVNVTVMEMIPSINFGNEIEITRLLFEWTGTTHSPALAVRTWRLPAPTLELCLPFCSPLLGLGKQESRLYSGKRRFVPTRTRIS
jgi:hypothetical protein